MIVSETGGREPVPEGTHHAVCITVAGIGLQESTYEGRTRQKAEVIISWEIPSLIRQNEDGDNYPVVYSSFYTASLGSKANLRKNLEGWRGRPFTSEELEGFDLKSLVGAPAKLVITHEHKSSGIKEKLASIMRFKREDGEPPRPGNRLIHYDPSDHDEDAFQALPEWIRTRVNRVGEEVSPNIDDDNDDIPF